MTRVDDMKMAVTAEGAWEDQRGVLSRVLISAFLLKTLLMKATSHSCLLKGAYGPYFGSLKIDVAITYFCLKPIFVYYETFVCHYRLFC